MWEYLISFNAMLEEKLFQNSVKNYLVMLIIFLLGALFVKFLERILIRHKSKIPDEKKNSLGYIFINILETGLIPLLYFGSFYLGISSLKLHIVLIKTIHILGTGLTTLFVVYLTTKLAEYMFRQEKNGHRIFSQGIFTLTKIGIWAFAIIFLLDNLGFKVSAIIAGLGIGGVAVALASQKILGDLFNHFVILLDRPFAVGDFIVLGEYMGVVESTGIKTTRIRSISGELLVIPNTDLTSSKIRNYKLMEKRRGVLKFGVTYQTTTEQLKEIPAIVKNIVASIQGTSFDHAHFTTFESSSLVFEVVYHVLSSDYLKYMDVQHQINLSLKEEFEKRKIEFAYPTQTLYMK